MLGIKLRNSTTELHATLSYFKTPTLKKNKTPSIAKSANISPSCPGWAQIYDPPALASHVVGITRCVPLPPLNKVI